MGQDGLLCCKIIRYNGHNYIFNVIKKLAKWLALTSKYISQHNNIDRHIQCLWMRNNGNKFEVSRLDSHKVLSESSYDKAQMFTVCNKLATTKGFQTLFHFT